MPQQIFDPHGGPTLTARIVSGEERRDGRTFCRKTAEICYVAAGISVGEDENRVRSAIRSFCRLSSFRDFGVARFFQLAANDSSRR